MVSTSRGSTARTAILVVALAIALSVAAVGSPLAVTMASGHSGGQVQNTTTATTVGIYDLTYSGPGVAVRQNDTTYVWMNGTTEVGAYVQPRGDPGEHELCVRLVRDNETVTDHGCQSVDIGQYGQFTTFELSRLGANESGRYDLVVELRDAEDPSLNQTRTISVVAVDKDGDIDDDGLPNADEVDLGTDIHAADTDADGLDDGTEVDKYDSDPLMPDTDEDGLTDGAEANQFNTSLTSADTDADGARDGVEVSKGTDPLVADTDGDGLTDGEEINEYDTDPLVADTDDDGLTDGEEVNEYDTDPTVADTDGDGIPDGEEVERGTDPTVPNTGSATVNASDGTGPGDGSAGGMLDDPLFLTVGVLLIATIVFGTYSRFGYPSPSGGDGDRPGDDISGGGADDTDSPEPLDPDLLSPEEYVTELLDRHGGRMQQRDIVEETDWSKAKVSRRLSKMEEQGVVERTRIGRGKVVERAHDTASDADGGR